SPGTTARSPPPSGARATPRTRPNWRGGSQGCRLPWSRPMASAPAGVLDAVGLDQPTVDRGLLVGFADAGQFREEVRPVGGEPGVESGVELVEDDLPSVQALGLRPGPEIGVPGLAGTAPFRLPLVQPARMVAGFGQPGEAPAGGGLVEPLPRPFHDHGRAAGH